MSRLPTGPLVMLAALTVIACGQARVDGGGLSAAGNRGGSGGGGGNGASTGGGLGGGVALPEAGAGSDAPPSPPNAGTCAEESVKADRLPVDLLLVVDASSSMASPGAGTTTSKYELVKQALIAFTKDPASAGLGLGLQFFPLPGTGSRCTTNADCGFPFLAPTPAPCQPVAVCALALAGGTLRGCGVRGGCPAGDSCLPLGRCKKSLADCTNLDQACPGGGADNLCLGVGSACDTSDGALCAPAAYAEVAAPIAALPVPGERLVTRELTSRGPTGATPLRPAVEGSLSYLRKHLAGQPGRKGVLVIATDGEPAGCAGNTVPETATLLAAARAATPAIPAYVIGVYLPEQAGARTSIQMLATAGGAAAPFIIGPNEDLARKFLDTLATIRGQALPCELAIPAPRPGAGPVDFGKVNVRFKGAGPEEDVLYTGGPGKCDPSKGGWYYDLDPATGATPTRIIACEATCRRWKAEPTATVDLRLGCQTRVIE